MGKGWLSGRFWVVLFSGEPGLVSECFRVAELFAHLSAEIEDMGEEHKRYKRTLEIQYPVDISDHFIHIDIHCIYYFNGHRDSPCHQSNMHIRDLNGTSHVSLNHLKCRLPATKTHPSHGPIEWAKDLPKRGDPNHRGCGSHLKNRAIWFINVNHHRLSKIGRGKPFFPDATVSKVKDPTYSVLQWSGEIKICGPALKVSPRPSHREKLVCSAMVRFGTVPG